MRLDHILAGSAIAAVCIMASVKPASAIALPDNSSCNTTSGNGCFRITNNATGTAAIKAVYGVVSAVNGSGVFGYNGISGTNAAGVSGQAPFGVGVFGSGASGVGVQGDGQTGVKGTTGSFSSPAIIGINSAGGGSTGNGVQGTVDTNSSGSAIYGEAAGSSVAWAGTFHGDVNVTGAYYVNGVLFSSDARLKKNIQDVKYGLTQILKLRPVTFEWKENSAGDETKIGVIAQEIQKVIPEVVKPNRATGMLTVDYAAIIPIAVKAIQEQEGTIDNQAKLIRQLETRVSAIEQGHKPLASSLAPFGLLLVPAGIFLARRRREARS